MDESTQKIAASILTAAILGAYSWAWSIQSQVAVVEAWSMRAETDLISARRREVTIAEIRRDLEYLRRNDDEIKALLTRSP